MIKQWVLREAGDKELVGKLAKAINVNLALADVLVQRGVTNFSEAKAFFRPSLEELHDPFLMKDMAVAVDRLNEAIVNNDKVLVYGDYDVDGTCSVALFFGFLKEYFDEIEFYIPDRKLEGYGVSQRGIEYAIAEGVKLIVTIDCGIKSVDKVALAKENGVDVIICDHHEPGDDLPPAIAILNPKQHDCSYPFEELCGCGVAFKLLHAFCVQNTIDFEGLFSRLDLVAVATSSDIVPMVGENRILTFFGLQKLKNDPQVGLKAILDVAGVEPKDLSVSKVVFTIGPRINAAGRLEHAKGAVSLLLEKNYTKAFDKATAINSVNLDRRELDATVLSQGLEMIVRNEEQSKKATVLYNPGWHKGVVGIAASRLIENYYRPTIILTKSQGKVVGSARSVEGFSVYDAILSCEEFLEQFGGHRYAAGMTMDESNVLAFKAKFEDVVAATITEEQLIPKVQIDVEINLDDITLNFQKILNQMEPFGPLNMTPVFVARNVKDAGGTRLLKGEHLKLEIEQGDSRKMNAIAFGRGDMYDAVKSGSFFDLCFTVDLNVFNGVTSLQLMVKDIKMKP